MASRTQSFLLRRNSEDLPREDTPYSSSMAHVLFAFFTILFFACLLSIGLIFFRRRRLAQKQNLTVPTYHHSSHHRSRSITNLQGHGQNQAVYVYDEQMNLIHNSPGQPSGAIPEIHITFPDDESKEGPGRKGRVVVVHITDSGSIGMEPVDKEMLPPYQKEDSGRFHSLDLERIGGLREAPRQRWS